MMATRLITTAVVAAARSNTATPANLEVLHIAAFVVTTLSVDPSSVMMATTTMAMGVRVPVLPSIAAMES